MHRFCDLVKGWVASIFAFLLFAAVPDIPPILADSLSRGAAGSPFLPANIIYQLDKNGQIIEKDPRVQLKDLDPALGMSKAVMNVIRATSGYIHCAGDKDHNSTTGSAVLYGNGMQLITAAHVVIDDNGRSRGRCYFRNQAAPANIVELDSADENILAFTRETKNHPNRDLAALHLKTRITNLTPLPLNRSGHAPAKGDPVIMVSAFMVGQSAALSPNEPVAQSCHVRDIDSPMPCEPIFLYNDCSMSSIASGSMLLDARGGRWTLEGIAVRSGPNSLDGFPYVRAIASESDAISLDPDVVRRLDAFEMKQRKQASNQAPFCP